MIEKEPGQTGITGSDIEEQIHYVQKLRKEDSATREGEGNLIYKIKEIQEFSRGEGDETIREQFYPGWIPQDFEKLLERLKEEGLLEE